MPRAAPYTTPLDTNPPTRPSGRGEPHATRTARGQSQAPHLPYPPAGSCQRDAAPRLRVRLRGHRRPRHRPGPKGRRGFGETATQPYRDLVLVLEISGIHLGVGEPPDPTTASVGVVRQHSRLTPEVAPSADLEGVFTKPTLCAPCERREGHGSSFIIELALVTVAGQGDIAARERPSLA